MRVYLLAILLVSFAGCADVETPAPEAAEPVDSIDLTEQNATIIDAQPYVPTLNQRAELVIGAGATIQFNGIGWGRISITAPGGSLPVKIMHEEWSDLGIFSDDGDDVYDDGYNHTFLAFGEPKKFGLDSSFVWSHWGTPGWGIWPSSNAWDEWDHTTLSYPEGTTLHLVVSTTVPGYSFKIGDGGSDVVWNLGDHPDVVLEWPEPSDAATVDEAVVEVDRRRDWRVGLTDQPPSYLMARAFTRNDGAIEAGVEGERLGWETSEGEQPLPLTPFPTYTITGNSWSASTASGVLENTASLDMFRTLETTKAKAIEKGEHGGFLAIPLE